jgi:hypothetical protein
MAVVAVVAAVAAGAFALLGQAAPQQMLGPQRA